ncbi:DUF3418 domain-containing protein, partial [Gammaproteobacteria bacterium]|nr:DUF3418 domain-containing protein [Gammaproteobacteria bacterium]
RKIAFSGIDPVVSREIFIREALVAMQLHTQVHFYHHNKKLVEQIEQIEEKTRRRDILVDEEILYQFYDRLIPVQVCDAASLDKWHRSLSKAERKALILHESDLISADSADFNLQQFPDQLQVDSMSLNLEYEFNPGKSQDGVSVNVPVSALKQLTEEDLDWLVPGMLREKCIALVKALPKALRKNFVPVPDYIDRIIPELNQGEGNLKYLLAEHLRRLSGIEIPLENWDSYHLEEHLKMNINVLDNQGNIIGTGRDISALREEFSEQIQSSLQRHTQDSIEQEGLLAWTFGKLEAVHEVDHAGIKIKTYPALVDEGESVALRLLDSEYQAARASQAGIVRLYMLNSAHQIKYLRKNLLQDASKVLLLKSLGSRDKLLDQLIRAAYLEAFNLDEFLPTTAEEFTFVFEKGRATLIETAERVEALLYTIMSEQASVQKALKGQTALADYHLSTDIKNQLAHLIFENFLFAISWENLKEIPRYLQAINERLARYPRQVQKDIEWTAILKNYWEQYQEKKQLLEKQEVMNKALDDFRWMLEEYRVSIFAQGLGTRFPVSNKRLEKHWQEKVLARKG